MEYYKGTPTKPYLKKYTGFDASPIYLSENGILAYDVQKKMDFKTELLIYDDSIRIEGTMNNLLVTRGASYIPTLIGFRELNGAHEVCRPSPEPIKLHDSLDEEDLDMDDEDYAYDYFSLIVIETFMEMDEVGSMNTERFNALIKSSSYAAVKIIDR